jgi:hypothetical protein
MEAMQLMQLMQLMQPGQWHLQRVPMKSSWLRSQLRIATTSG